ncbi:MAG: YfiR family protein [Desulfobacteraceae bacterium]|nr:YfiR family protein [Desulfobacteraceae bacterium]
MLTVKRIKIILLLLPVVGCLLVPALAQQQVGEYQIKAAFLYNFAKFVDWPACNACNDSDFFIIGILGDDPFREEIEAIAGKSVKEKRLAIERSATLEGLKNCQVIFISASAKTDLPRILKKLKDQPVLTVGDTPGFAEAGVMINLYTADNKIRFEINPAAADQAGLKISSQLLKLARIVESKE